MFKSKAIPSGYKIFLAAHLLSYTIGGIYLLVFTVAATARILDNEISEASLRFTFNSAGFLAVSYVVRIKATHF
jgi:hypothetical protein